MSLDSKRVLAWLKKTNYANEKTPTQRALRSIKRCTRQKYSLKNAFCLCGNPATEHHHTTDPITKDDFLFVCHNCHVLIHSSIKGVRK